MSNSPHSNEGLNEIFEHAILLSQRGNVPLEMLQTRSMSVSNSIQKTNVDDTTLSRTNYFRKNDRPPEDAPVEINKPFNIQDRLSSCC